MARYWKEIKGLLVVILAVTSFRSAIADWNDVPSGSMQPAILIGDRIVVNKLAYDLKVPFTQIRIAEWSQPERFDIVVFFSPEDGTRLVKRVVGLPGDRLEVIDGTLNINGESAEYWSSPAGDVEAYGELGHPVQLGPTPGRLDDFGPVEVPPGQYFMMGDNRGNSRDSRYFGFVDESLIAGRAEAVALSLDKDAGFMPRGNRFLQPLK